jgi:hypothetical protein
MGTVEVGSKDGDDEGHSSKINVFNGSIDVDILDLTEVSAVISAVELPAGKYTKIRITVGDPRLVLKADPDTVITNVKVPSSVLQISKNFELPEGEQSLLLLDFGGIHLVERGNGGFNLTPQLRADVNVQNAAVQLSGTIDTIDLDEETITVDTGSGLVEVDISEAVITSAGDLTEGDTVTVDGIMSADGSVQADTVVVDV